VNAGKPPPMPIWLWITGCCLSGLAISATLLHLLGATRPLP
jgi:hypothetical protein